MRQLDAASIHLGSLMLSRQVSLQSNAVQLRKNSLAAMYPGVPATEPQG